MRREKCRLGINWRRRGEGGGGDAWEGGKDRNSKHVEMSKS